MRNCFKILFSLFIIVLLCQPAVAQKKRSRIKLLGAEKHTSVKGNRDLQLIQGNVRMMHENTLLLCDSAYMNSRNNNMEAFGQITIQDEDVVITGDHMLFFGDTRTGVLTGDCKMVNGKMTLVSTNIHYDLKADFFYYKNGGTIIDGDDTLKSVNGYYYADTKEYFFKKDVQLHSTDYKMYSDTLYFNSEQSLARFFGPTDIISDSTFLYCERGWYNTESNIAQLYDNALLSQDEYRIKGDSLYYEKANRFGRAMSNVWLADTINKVYITGELGEYKKSEGYAFVTRDLEAILLDENNDSLFMHADSIWIHFDSTNTEKDLLAYSKVKFYHKNYQAICDSLAYSFPDSMLWLYTDPVLWEGDNQIYSDSMEIHMKQNTIYRAYFNRNCFMSDIDSLQRFNQIKGKKMTAFFADGEIYMMDVNGNAESIYYVTEEDGSMIGINKAAASQLRIFIKEKAISGISFIAEPVGALHPEDDLTEKEKFLKGFFWLDKKRPQKREDIFLN